MEWTSGNKKRQFVLEFDALIKHPDTLLVSWPGMVVSSNVLHEQNQEKLGFLMYVVRDHAPELRRLPICIAVCKSINLPGGPVDKPLLFFFPPLWSLIFSLSVTLSRIRLPVCVAFTPGIFMFLHALALLYIYELMTAKECACLCVFVCQVCVCVRVCLPPQGEAPDGLKTTNNLPDPLIILSDSISS